MKELTLGDIVRNRYSKKLYVNGIEADKLEEQILYIMDAPIVKYEFDSETGEAHCETLWS